ncbi:MAG: hypothetical protein R3185_06915 [Candidatus Thermoplasmatota archaeon]|nr:hypothetical protein [Candidatus Thermoplasmatota archaeon]
MPLPASTVVGVMGPSQAPPAVVEQAETLGRRIAQAGWALLTGGRDAGIMDAASHGARQAGGLTIGILPGRPEDGGVSGSVQVPIFTGMGDARNVINVLSSRAIVALPGGPGTLSEVALALKAGRPVALLGWPEGHDLMGPIGHRAHRVASVDEAIAWLHELLG